MSVESWPPGGFDPELDLLAERHIDRDGRLDLASLLADPAVGRTALVSSFGAEAAVLLHLVAEAAPATPVIFLDTGKHFPETLAYRDALVARFGLTDVRSVGPDATLLDSEDPDGGLHGRDPDMCCTLRKTFPLQDALIPFQSWITGRKRFHSGTRASLPLLERDGRHIKINPLATWDRSRIEAHFAAHDIPRHPLMARGYVSIGCRPCTRPVQPGESLRAGRWAGSDKTECGIHLGPDGRFARNRG